MIHSKISRLEIKMNSGIDYFLINLMVEKFLNFKILQSTR